MIGRIALFAVLVLAAGIVLVPDGARAHPFDESSVAYGVNVSDNAPGAPADLNLALRFGVPSVAPEPFAGIVHHPPPGWRIAPDEQVPNGDQVGRFVWFLDNPLIMGPEPCPLAPTLGPLNVSLFDASSDSSAVDYPPFLPPGDHKARYTGRFQFGEAAIPVNVLVDTEGELDTEEALVALDALRVFVGTGQGPTGYPPVDSPLLGPCFSLLTVLQVAGKSSSGIPVAVNPTQPGPYTFTAGVTSVPDPEDDHRHTISLTAKVPITPVPIGYGVGVRDRNPGVPSDLVMKLDFPSKRILPELFGGISHRAPPEWRIAPDEGVHDGDGVARLHLRLNRPQVLPNHCSSLLPMQALALSVPLRDASSDSSAPSYPPFLPPGEHKARWAGLIGRPERGIPVNVLVDEGASGETAMRLFIGAPHLSALRPLLHCLSVDVALQVRGLSRAGTPIAVNPGTPGKYTFAAHIITMPQPPDGERKVFDLKARVVIEPSPRPEPCLDCPPQDEDGDAIIDADDLCPSEPEDIDEHEATDGCPDSGDSDGDEIVDLMELLLGADPASGDTDADGCLDGRELTDAEGQGGRRDPTSFWDFYDVYTGNPLARDGAIIAADIAALVLRFGATGDPNGDPLLVPPDLFGYHTAFDRGGTVPGQNVWNLEPPDGAIVAGDIALLVLQFGHTCVGPP